MDLQQSIPGRSQLREAYKDLFKSQIMSIIESTVVSVNSQEMFVVLINAEYGCKILCFP